MYICICICGKCVYIDMYVQPASEKAVFEIRSKNVSSKGSETRLTLIISSPGSSSMPAVKFSEYGPIVAIQRCCQDFAVSSLEKDSAPSVSSQDVLLLR